MNINGTYRGFAPVSDRGFGEARLVIDDQNIIYTAVTEGGVESASYRRIDMKVMSETDVAGHLFGDAIYGIIVDKNGPYFVWSSSEDRGHQVFTRWPNDDMSKHMPWFYTPVQVEAGMFDRSVEGMAKYSQYLVPLTDLPAA